MMKIRIKKKAGIDLFSITIFVNVLIPKAGFKIGGIPITVGLILFVLTITQYCKSVIRNKKVCFRRTGLLILALMCYFLFRLGLPVFLGVDNNELLISYITSLCICPIMYFITQVQISDSNSQNRIMRSISFGTAIIMVYALIQLLFGIERVTIPGISVNLTDYLNAPDRWWLMKHNGFGGVNSKIVSTYQNGNLFSVNLLMIFPLVNRYIKKFNIKIVYWLLFIVSIFISGCRSAMFGMVVYILVLIIEELLRRKHDKNLIPFLSIGLLGIIMSTVYFKDYFIVYANRIESVLDLNKFLRATGRTENFFYYIKWICSNKFFLLVLLFGSYGLTYLGGAYEILIACIFILGGLVGVILFLLPILYAACNAHKGWHKSKNMIAKGSCESIIVYLFTSISEGAYWLLPTSILLWFVVGVAELSINVESGE